MASLSWNKTFPIIVLCSSLVLLTWLDLIILFPVVVACSISIIYLYLQDWVLQDSYLIIFLAFCSLLLPPLQLPSGLPEIRVEEIIIYCVLPFYIIIRFENVGSTARTFLLLYATFIGLQIFSLLYGKFFMGVSVGTRDYFEIIKTTKYGILIGAISTLTITDKSLKTILTAISYFFLIVTVIGLMQFYSILGLDRITGPLFIQERLYDINNRMMGTFYNPNTFSAALSIGFVVTLLNQLVEKDTLKKFVFFTISVLILWSVILTQSRTGLAVLILGTSIFLVLNTIQANTNIGYGILIISGFVLISIIVLSFVSSDTLTRYTSGLDIMNDPSWQLRLIAWYLNLKLFSQSILFGWGPAKHQFTTIVDSEYILVLRQYGIIGFLVNIIGFYLYPLLKAYKNISDQTIRGYFLRFFTVASMMFLISNITNPLFHEIQFMDFWCLFTGILLVLVSENYKNELGK